MFRKLLLVTATALPAVLASYTPSSAAAFLLTPPIVTPGSPPTQATFGNTVSGSFSDTYAFMLVGASNEVSIATDSLGDITNFSISIAPVAPGTGTGAVSNQVTNIAQSLFSVMETATLTTGAYILTVSGVAAATTAYNGTASFSTIAVPGPIAGAGLVSLLGFAGLFLAKRRGGASIAA